MPKLHLIPDTRPLSPGWFAARRAGITSTDVPIIAGLSPYGRTTHDLYLEKRGEGGPQPESDDMLAGRVLEGAIADWYGAKTGRPVRRVRGLAYSPAMPWARASLDRIAGGRVVEIKRRRRWHTLADAPDVDAQVQWQLGVTGYPVADVVVLEGGGDFRIEETEADPDYFQDLAVIAKRFWDDTLDGIAPDLDGSAGAARYLAARHPSHTDDLLPADADMAALVAAYREATAALEQAQGNADTVKNAIKAVIGDAAGIVGPGYRVTWKRVADSRRTDWKQAAEWLGNFVGPDTWQSALEIATEPVEGGRRFLARFE